MRIARVKKEIRDTPYDKASEHHHGRLKAKLARLQADFDGPMNKGGGGGMGYAVKHSGDVCVVLVGPPSVGKSTLLNALTNAESKVGNYDFTTLGVVPGMMEYKGVRMQILDLPGILAGASKNRGFGKKVVSVVRAADLVVLVTDVGRPEWLEKMERELYKAGIRLEKRLPKIGIKKTNRGAIRVVDAHKSFAKDTVVGVTKELGFANAVIQLEEKIGSLDELIDALVGNRKYMSVVRVVNKIDTVKNFSVTDYKWKNVVGVSAEKGLGLDKLRKVIWQSLDVVRVYLKKRKSGEADKKKPLIMKKGKTLVDVAGKISAQMAGEVTTAYIWGKKAKFPGQKVSLKRQVFDEMEVWLGR